MCCLVGWHLTETFWKFFFLLLFVYTAFACAYLRLRSFWDNFSLYLFIFFFVFFFKPNIILYFFWVFALILFSQFFANIFSFDCVIVFTLWALEVLGIHTICIYNIFLVLFHLGCKYLTLFHLGLSTRCVVVFTPQAVVFVFVYLAFADALLPISWSGCWQH